jgi:hypothetical protein
MSQRNKQDSGIAQREVLIQERTVLVEEDASPSRGSNTDVAGLPASPSDPPLQVTRHRQHGDLSSAQYRLLENLERLTHSLQGPEQSLDRHSYSRPFPHPQPINGKQT